MVVVYQRMPAVLTPTAPQSVAVLHRWYSLLALWPGLPANARRPLPPTVTSGSGQAAAAAAAPSAPPTSQRYLVDAVVPQQGPNYILAKRLQHWRAILTAAEGSNVSSSVAPATATASVLSNKAVGA
eukprot:COSAG01_NODE_157_length_23722_cov_85.712568_16_plen_127_part_00